MATVRERASKNLEREARRTNKLPPKEQKKIYDNYGDRTLDFVIEANDRINDRQQQRQRDYDAQQKVRKVAKTLKQKFGA